MIFSRLPEGFCLWLLSEYKGGVEMLFEPVSLQGLTIPNRVVMPAMCQYSSEDEGEVAPWHLTHYTARAQGKVGLIILEATAVEKRGRLSDRDLGIFSTDQVLGLKNLVSLCRGFGSVMGIQLGHGGRKSFGEEGVAPSALAVEGYPMPHVLSIPEIQSVVESFATGARLAQEAGFQVLQLHGAHGYLIHQFLSPLSNHRADVYGGSLQNRMRFLLEILEAVVPYWKDKGVVSVRLSATDYLPQGLDLQSTVEIGKILKQHGVSLLDISAGGLLSAPISVFPGYMVPFAERVKKEVGLPTIAVGGIKTRELAEEIIHNQRGDFVALGRALLRNPYWVLEASAQWPKPYSRL